MVIPCRYNFRAHLSACEVSLLLCVFFCFSFSKLLFHFRFMLCCRFWRIKMNITSFHINLYANKSYLIDVDPLRWLSPNSKSCRKIHWYSRFNRNTFGVINGRWRTHWCYTTPRLVRATPAQLSVTWMRYTELTKVFQPSTSSNELHAPITAFRPVVRLTHYSGCLDY